MIKVRMTYAPEPPGVHWRTGAKIFLLHPDCVHHPIDPIDNIDGDPANPARELPSKIGWIFLMMGKCITLNLSSISGSHENIISILHRS